MNRARCFHKTYNVDARDIFKRFGIGNVVDEAGDVAMDLVRHQRVRHVLYVDLSEHHCFFLGVHLNRVDGTTWRSCSVNVGIF